MESGDELETLMARYQAGDMAAATALIERLSPRLQRYFTAQYSSRGHAGDLLQETWLRIHGVRRSYRRGEPVLPWIYAIARHVRIDHHRRAIRTVAREAPLEEVSAVAAAAIQEHDELAALLAPLPESQREVIVMLKVIGMSLEEVARATACSVGSVKQKAHRAYESLRNSLTAREPSTRRRGEPT